jgi:hypothetical protein
MIRKVEMERFTVTSSKPFDAVVAAIKASIGHPNMAELWQATQRATTAAELAAIQPALGKTGLMQFAEFDHGTIVRKGTENHTSKMIRLVIENPLIMKEMAKRVPDAGSYAPVTVRWYRLRPVIESRRIGAMRRSWHVAIDLEI